MESICSALKNGATIRHRDWPPFQYARLHKAGEETVELHRIYPNGRVELIEVAADELRHEKGWSVLDPRSYD